MIAMDFRRYLLLSLCLAFISCTSVPPDQALDEGVEGEVEREADMEDGEAEISLYPELPPLFEDLPVSAFGEIWGYLISGREQALQRSFPLSDVGYFGAEVDSYGQLTGVPNPSRISFFSGRTHLVVTCNSRGLTHFVLEPGSRTRTQLVADLLRAAAPYDGLQIDFELVPARDGENFLSFLEDLRGGLRDKMLTVALPARMRTLQNDVYDYRKILPLVDRILVMAYDEHWSTSEPGPIASLAWCRSVGAYALSVIGKEKLIMGLPFYGRTWGDVNPSRAFFHSGIERIKQENQVTEIRRENGIPSFTYEVPLTITAYYEDEYSLASRLDMYRGMGVRSVGFWSLGQEAAGVWGLLRLEEAARP
jgi:spore germination protein YaaH